MSTDTKDWDALGTLWQSPSDEPSHHGVLELQAHVRRRTRRMLALLCLELDFSAAATG